MFKFLIFQNLYLGIKLTKKDIFYPFFLATGITSTDVKKRTKYLNVLNYWSNIFLT